MISDILKKHSSTNKNITNEYQFFRLNKHVLKDYKFMEHYFLANDSFDIIKANIIIKSMLNKEKIEKLFTEIATRYANNTEKLLEDFRNEISKLSLLTDGYQKIFIAFFDRATNLIYYDNIFKIEEFPYSALIGDIKSIYFDPFETYGDKIFESGFTELVKIDEDKTSGAYYHYQLDTLFFINNQGFLDFQLNIFDKYLKFKDHDDIVERLRCVTRCYYKTNRNEMLSELVKNKLISHKMSDKINFKLTNFYKLRFKKWRKGSK